jgi:nicotinate phosphoribosyltransferase
LIGAYGGDTVKATKRFAETIEGVDVIALVDYDNDSVKTSLDVARALEGRLWGVRLDTAEYMVDKSVIPQMGDFRPTGVNAPLVWNVRNALDAEGFGDVKIVVSRGFDVLRIQAFEEEGVPVDAYGVGAALYDGQFDFTADIVQVNGKAEGKAGRRLRPNPRLERVK